MNSIQKFTIYLSLVVFVYVINHTLSMYNIICDLPQRYSHCCSYMDMVQKHIHEELEDTKDVIIIRKSRIDRQYNG